MDKAGVVVVGFSVYGGGGIHEYELEVLVDDVSTTFEKKLNKIFFHNIFRNEIL